MKRITLLAAVLAFLMLSACAPKETPTAPKETQTETPVAEPAADTPASNVVSTHYLEGAVALAADDLEKAKAAFAALAKETTGEMKTLAQAAADTGDIAATREKFKALSALATTMELPEGYAVAFCPMYKGGSKWVQKRDKLANPYYGKTMLTCGSFVD